MANPTPKIIPSRVQRAMLDAAMGVAYESGESFSSYDEMKLFLQREGAPAVCLLDENARELMDCFVKYFTLGRAPQADRQAPVVVNGAVTPPQSNKSDEGITAVGQERAAVGEDQDSEELLTFEEDEEGEPRTFFLHASRDSSATFEAFIACMCKQKTSFLSAESARRLGLKSVPGSKHTLCWHSKSDGMGRKTHRTPFTVVNDVAIPTNVAVGTGWSTEEPGSDIDDAESSHSTQEQAQPLDDGCRVQPWLSQQAQQGLMAPPPAGDYPTSSMTTFSAMYLDHLRQLQNDTMNHGKSFMNSLHWGHFQQQMPHHMYPQLQPRPTPQRPPGGGDPP